MHTHGVVVPSRVSDPYSVLTIYENMFTCLLFKGKEETSILIAIAKRRISSRYNTYIKQLTSYYDKYVAKWFIGPELSHILQIQVYHKLARSRRSSLNITVYECDLTYFYSSHKERVRGNSKVSLKERILAVIQLQEWEICV